MRVRVLFFGQLKDITGKTEEEIEAPEGATLEQLFEQCARRYPKLAEQRRSLAFARNHEFARPAEPLAEGDEVALLPPVSGG